jgi:distribution and morphology protein 31
VYVSRRPTEDDVDDEEDQSDDADDNNTKVATRRFENVGKGGRERLRLASPDDAASLSSSSSLMVNSTTTSADGTSPSALDEATEAKRQRLRENNNYTMFDVNFEEVDVTLSLVRWLSGKGLVKEAKVRGVRGVIGRLDVPPDSVNLVAQIKAWRQQIEGMSGGITQSHSSQPISGIRPRSAISNSSRCR